MPDTPDTLPPLPKPVSRAIEPGWRDGSEASGRYTADQMRAYARAAIAERDAEIERLRAEVSKMADKRAEAATLAFNRLQEIKRLRAEVAALREALEATTYCLRWHADRAGNLADTTAIEQARAALCAARAAGE